MRRMVKGLTRHPLHAALLQLGLVQEAIRELRQDMMNGLPRLRAEIGTTRHADDAEQGSRPSGTGLRKNILVAGFLPASVFAKRGRKKRSRRINFA
jgi:hypothetical protein